MRNERILEQQARRAGLTTPISGDGIVCGWAGAEEGWSLHRDDDGCAVVRSDHRGDAVRARLEALADAEAALLLAFGVLARETRRRVKDWKEQGVEAPVAKTTGGHLVTASGRRAVFASVADARAFAAYVELRREARFPEERLMTALLLPEELEYGLPEGWTTDDLETLYATTPIDATTPPRWRGEEPMSLLGKKRIDLATARWLIEHGADARFRTGTGRTPLLVHAASPDLVRLLLEHGADVDAGRAGRDAPIHTAAAALSAESARLLLAAGADPDATSLAGWTPLELVAFRTERLGQAPRALETARALLESAERRTVAARPAGALRDAFQSAARAHEEGRIDAERLQPMRDLLALLSIPEPEPLRTLAAGEPITVTSEDVVAQYRELWQLLVPDSGPAESAQGEAVRIIGRVGHELWGNGGANWDADFERMLDAFVEHAGSGSPLPEERLAAVSRARAELRGGALVKPAVDELTRASVEWVLRNPDRIPLPKPRYRR